MALHVSTKGMSLRAVIDPLEVDVGHLDHRFGQGLAEGFHVWEWPPGRWMADPHEPHRDNVLFARQARGERRLARRLYAQVSPGAKHGASRVDGKRKRGNERGARDLMQLEFEFGDDAEVATATAKSPIEIGVLGLARVDDLAVGGDHLERHDVVAGKPMLSGQPSHATAEGEATYARMRNVAGRRCQPMLLSRSVERP